MKNKVLRKARKDIFEEVYKAPQTLDLRRRNLMEDGSVLVKDKSCLRI